MLCSHDDRGLKVSITHVLITSQQMKDDLSDFLSSSQPKSYEFGDLPQEEYIEKCREHTISSYSLHMPTHMCTHIQICPHTFYEHTHAQAIKQSLEICSL